MAAFNALLGPDASLIDDARQGGPPTWPVTGARAAGRGALIDRQEVRARRLACGKAIERVPAHRRLLDRKVVPIDRPNAD